MKRPSTDNAAGGAGLVLLVLAAGQFLMTLDSSVMNVSIATVAKDLGTTVTGIQSAITLYTLIMASLMITGGKIGAIIGRRRAFATGLVIYSVGSFTTAIAPSLPVLILGWSVLEGVGAALATGVRLVPLSISLLVTALLIPKLRPNASPRRVVRVGLLLLLAGAVVLAAGLDPAADASIVTVPMLLMGTGIGALASQLGAVTVSAVSDEQSAEVGGLQNTATNLGASLGTALVGSILIASLTATFIDGIAGNPDVPESVKAQASTELAGGIPFISSTDLEVALSEAGVPADLAAEVIEENAVARLAALQASMAIVAGFALAALFFSNRIPNLPIGGSPNTAHQPAERAAGAPSLEAKPRAQEGSS